MNEITLKLTQEQFMILIKTLEPYMKLYVTLNNQYKIQSDMAEQKQNIDEEIESRR